jgi:hypothetical protein
MTHCVGEVLERLHAEHSDLIFKTFRDTGISLDPSGSSDHLLNIKDMADFAKDIGNADQYGLNSNLEVRTNGKRRTDKSLIWKDSWPKLWGIEREGNSGCGT